MTSTVVTCRCTGYSGGGAHLIGSGSCEYPRPRGDLPGPEPRPLAGVPNPGTEQLRMEFLENFIIAGSSGEKDDRQRKQLLQYWEDMKQDYQRRLIRQSNMIHALRDEVIILKDIQLKMHRMIEELLETEGQDVDPTIYARRLRRLMEGSNADGTPTTEG